MILFGEWKTNTNPFPKQYVKETLKILGVYYGKNQEEKNVNRILQSMMSEIRPWTNYESSFIGRKYIINTYVLSKLWYVTHTINISKENIQKINSIIYKFLWKGPELIKRKQLIQIEENGGIGMSDINTKLKCNMIQQIKKMNDNRSQPWVALYIYWLGFTTRFLWPNFGRNHNRHSDNIPMKYKKIRELILENRDNTEIWKLKNTKDVYKKLLKTQEIKPKIETMQPLRNWKKRWKIMKLKKYNTDKSMIYMILNETIKTGELLKRRSIIRDSQKCPKCEREEQTTKHIILTCPENEKDLTEFKIEFKNEYKIDILENDVLNIDEILPDGMLNKILDYVIKRYKEHIGTP